MNNERQREKFELTIKFGLLLQPLVEMVAKGEHSTSAEWQIALAKVNGGEGSWNKSIQQFCRLSSDIFYDIQYREMVRIPILCRKAISQHLEKQTYFLSSEIQEVISLAYIQGELDKAKNSFYKSLKSIPIDWEPEIFAANTPFASYLKIKQAITPAKTRLYYFDRYLKKEFFDLFLANVDRNIKVRIVTTTKGVNEVRIVSKLVNIEFKDYELIEVDRRQIHDRNLWVDDQNFALGPGVDGAGMALTNFDPADSSPEAFAQLEAVIASGQVVL